MKKNILILLFIISATITFGQGRQLEITCEVTAGRIDYGNLQRLLPDSLKSDIIVSLKTFHTLNDVGVINFLTLQGWKIAGFSNEVDGDARDIDSKKVYVLKRDIYVSHEEHALILDRLKEYRKGNK